MKKLLNNPWFIVGLSACAFVLLGLNILSALDEDVEYTQDVDEYDWLDGNSLNAQPIAGESQLTAVITEGLYWNTSPKRDPFGPSADLDKRDVSYFQNKVIFETGDNKLMKPVLSALIAGENSRFAMINGGVVQEGDYVAGFLVQQIDRGGVWLQARNGGYRLRLNQGI